MTRTFTYQWQRYTGTWDDIGGATGADYTPQAADEGYPLRLKVTPSDGSPAYSNETAATLEGLLWVDFSTPAAAPVSSYAGVIGALTVTDSLSTYSAADDVLAPSLVSTSTEPAIRSTGSFALVGGLALVQQLRLDSVLGATTATTRIGLSADSASPPVSSGVAGLRPQPSLLLFTAQDFAAINTAEAFAFDTDYVVAIVARSSGGYLGFINGHLVWVGISPSWSTPVYAHSAATTVSATPPTYTYWRVALLPAPLDTDYGAAVLHQASPVSGTDYTGTADMITDALTITLPGAPSAGQVAIEMRYNVLDANNYNWVRIVRNVGNTAWNLLAGKVVATVSTTLLTASGVGTPDALRAIHTGSAHDFYTSASGTWTKRGTQFSDSNQSTSTTVSVVLDSTTVGFLDVWARDDDDYHAILEATL